MSQGSQQLLGRLPDDADLTAAQIDRCQRLSQEIVARLGIGLEFEYLPRQSQRDLWLAHGLRPPKPEYVAVDELAEDLQRALDELKTRGTPRERLANLVAGTSGPARSVNGSLQTALSRGSVDAAPKLVVDREYLPLALELIAGASKRLVIAMNRLGLTAYRAHPVRRLVEVTAEAVRRGVDVQLLSQTAKARGVEPHGAALRAFGEAGATLLLKPAGHAGHHKALVVDRAVLLTGSHGFTLPSLSKNSETSALIRSPALAEQALTMLLR